MAEARCAVHEPRVEKLKESEEFKQNIFREWRRSTARRFYRTRYTYTQAGKWGDLVIDPLRKKIHTCDFIGLPNCIRAFITSVIVGFWFFIVLLYFRRYFLRCLLSYRGWMYEQPKTQSISTILWGLSIKLVSGYHPKLYSCQRSLPRMPVPPLQETIGKLLESIKPLYAQNDKKWIAIQKEAEEFQRTIGPQLQWILVFKSWWSPNYVTDWEKYVYLMGRTPTPINSNYYIMDQEHFRPSTHQTARTSSAISQFLKFKQLCDHETLEPLRIRNTVPVCMKQYERMYSTSRVPGEDIDYLVHYDSKHSKHLAVLRKGIIYKMDVYDKFGKLLTAIEIKKQLEWIIKDADIHEDDCSESEKLLPALTGIERADWAKSRSQYFSHGVNKDSLDIVERAIFFVVLDWRSFKSMSERATFLMCGDGQSIWFDKTFTLISFSDGRIGLNCEHSFADAPILAHMAEFNYTNEALKIVQFDDHGNLIPTPEDEQKFFVTKPQRLVWEVTSDLNVVLQSAKTVNLKNKDDLDLCVREHESYGKGFMKSCKVSPDAYIQMALQVTYFKNAGKFALTYESSMTRLYLHGRTETVRSLTTDSVEFVRAFLDKSISHDEKLRLLQKACNRHQGSYRDAMSGRGIDRHLFALYVVSKGMGKESSFLKDALTIPWELSTSQQPQQQFASSPDCSLPQYKNFLCPGGGFGPVSDDGYGVSYMIPGDAKVFFHVSAKKSVKETDATLFMNQLFETLQEMKELFSKK
ncbi:hypothetical protein FSP39_008296 [Pinctada imbricata]|uniref:Choline/carnitine acyltransferase domain-containing protein n=1 Tax=Pinctada imbricata TaxID=66713 RepID=A0AA89C0W3_PINIB|nr:hypothetical protein FSP39_008296 [Pinctada imbricata]